MASSGEWQRWDVDGVAEQIDAYWQTSAYELAHRAALGDFCARYLTSRDFRVLEVGCGTGRIYEQLVPRLLPESGYAGIDVSERMLAIARRRLPGVAFRRGDGYAIDAADGAVDYTLAFAVLGHLPEVGPFLRELGRVARRGVLFTVWPATETEGVVDEREFVRPTEFLHRRYPSSWLAAQLAAAVPHLRVDLEIAIMDQVWAYAALWTDGAPGVSAPRLIASGPGTSGAASP